MEEIHEYSRRSLQQTAEAKDYLGEYIPFSGSMRNFNDEKRAHDAKAVRLTSDEIEDFRVPADILKKNCAQIWKMKPWVKNRMLTAVGVTVQPGREDLAKIDWEQFLMMSKMLNVKCPDRA